MLISYSWLQEYIDGKLPKPEKLAELLTMHSFEVESAVKAGKDFVFDIAVLPNRAHDCLSHVGVAKEVGVLTKSKVKSQKSKVIENKKYKVTDYLDVKVKKPRLCLRSTSRVILGVKVGDSPKWLADKLIALGQKPINNIVDATNYTMFALGQPLHAFDLDKISGRQIIVRLANKGEKIVTLDNKEYELNPDILVMADTEGPLDIAGVKGGKKAELDVNTKNIALESAYFDSGLVRKVSKTLQLRTDASVRFENGVVPQIVPEALDYVAQLIKEIAGGEIASGALDIGEKKYQPTRIAFTPEKICKLLGLNISTKEMLDILNRLGFKIVKKFGKDGFLVEVPRERLDVINENDIAEEVVRVYGIWKLPAILPTAPLTPAKSNDEYLLAVKIKQLLAGAGMSESQNRSFVSDGSIKLFDSVGGYKNLVEIANPLSKDQAFLRSSLFFHLIENCRENLKHFNEVHLFELGNVFKLEDKKVKETNMLAGVFTAKIGNKAQSGREFYELKGVLETLFERLGLDDVWYDDFRAVSDYSHHSFWHKTRVAEIKVGDKKIGMIGEINPVVLHMMDVNERVSAFEISTKALLEVVTEEVFYTPISKFPAIKRDVAILVPQDTKINSVENIIEQVGGELLFDVDLFDIYEGENLEDNQKSLAFHLIFQSSSRTLKDEEVNEIFSRITKALAEKGWEIRE